MPGAHVALPDGRHVWQYEPRVRVDDGSGGVGESRGGEVLPDAQLTASEQRALPGEGARW